MIKVYDKIRTLRTMKGLSQEHMAEQLGLSQSSYGKLERGITKVTINKLFRVAEIFDMNVVDLIYYNEMDSPMIRLMKKHEKEKANTNAAENKASLAEEQVKYLKKMNDLLEAKVKDKDEIIKLLRKELSGKAPKTPKPTKKKK